MNFSLNGKTALVTGARTGIGRSIAQGLHEAGAKLILVGRGDLSDVAPALATISLDLSDPASIEPALTPVLAEHGVDILVNNAGTIHRGAAVDVSLSDWQRIMAVNLDSAFEISKLCGRHMVAQGSGKVINIASLLSFQGGILVSAYTASKHALVGMTKLLANEWASSNVQVNAIAPGYIETNNTAPLRADPDREPSIRARIPAGRWGKPEDLVGPTVFLSSAASDYVTGHVLVVDGGWLAR
ncbi:MAG: 2-dehydro-3-deoxy-D-gluconate 5-dehydrogenase [Pseudonocardiales bacterium]|nr:2-dehydro-3-deoxy-D-gluconate 5-dehydrogenase [Pseudonocardiales bacterium]